MHDINRLKEIQLDILIDVDRICKKHDIKYYIIGGTLLGAVRHKGFIPWDDDIDIVMPRNDLNRFQKIIINDYQDRYFLQNPHTDKNYLRYITKVRKKGTKLIEEAVESVEMNHGIYIDIFPLDKINIDHPRLNNFKAYLGKFGRNLKRRKVMGSDDKKGVKSVGNSFLAAIIPISLIDSFIEFIYQSGNKASNKHYTNFGSKYGWDKQTYPVEVFGEGIELEFEGHYFIAPEKWENILESIYGDYMSLPPEDKQVSGHKIIELDFGNAEPNHK